MKTNPCRTATFPSFLDRAGLSFFFLLWMLLPHLVQARPEKQLYYNQDCTDFFWTRDVPPGQAGEAIDRYVDEIANAGVTVFLCNSNARRTNYRSRVWDAFWDGYAPDGPDDQPFLSSIPKGEIPAYRKGIGNMLKVHQQGVDYPGRVIQRCRFRNISPWISLRMNDCHYNDIPNHPFHGGFWRDNPQLQRKNSPGYFATCLDYALPEVREFYLALVQETLDRYDLDGLELDFMREPYLFSAKEEAPGTVILTEWLRQVRQRVQAAAAKRGHPIRLGVRVPSRPETAKAMGLDAVSWANEGLVDLLVVTPRWATLEYDLPIAQWRQLLGKANVTLVGGLEILYRPVPSGSPSQVSPELALGAATLVLSEGADAVYLFNYFPPTFSPSVYQSMLRSMTSLDFLSKLPRRVGITYRDITGPGESYKAPLPAIGQKIVLSMKLGPAPAKGWIYDLIIRLASPAPDASSTEKPAVPTPENSPSAFVNGVRCDFVNAAATNRVFTELTYRIPAQALQTTQAHELKLVSANEKPMNIQAAEVFLRPAGPQ